jgi:hypothetical protein
VRAASALTGLGIVLLLSGCAVLTVAGTAVSVAGSVAGSVVSAGVGVAGKVVEAGIEMATPSKKKD